MGFGNIDALRLRAMAMVVKYSVDFSTTCPLGTLRKRHSDQNGILIRIGNEPSLKRPSLCYSLVLLSDFMLRSCMCLV